MLQAIRIALAIVTVVTPSIAAADGADDTRWADRVAPVFRQVASLSDRDTGLPYTASPVALAQDDKGFIWVGTETGLERWDGYHIREYTARPGDVCGLRGGAVWTLLTDERKRLWIGTRGGGVARYDPETDCIRSVGNGADALTGATVETLASDGAGGLWVGATTGLLHVAADFVHVTRASPDLSESGRFTHERIVSLLRDRTGALWLGATGGLWRLGPSQKRFVAVPLPVSDEVGTLFESSDGQIWVGTIVNGAFVIDPSTSRVRAVPELRQHLPAPEIRNFAETPAGEIWAATTTTGIVAIDARTLRTRILRHQRGAATSLPEDYASDVLRDRNGLIWVALKSGFGFFNSTRGVSTILLADDKNGLPEATVRTLARLSDDRIALKNDNQIAIIGPQDTGHETVRLGLQSPVQRIGKLASANGRDLFAFTQPSGLIWMDLTSQRSYPVPLPGQDPTPEVDALLADGDRLWVGDLHHLWLVQRRTDGGQSSLPWRATRQFSLRDVIVIAAGSGDTRWVGTANGLYRVDAESSEPARVPLTDSAGAALPDPYVTSLLSDQHGRLWVGAGNQGLFLVDPPTGQTAKARVLRQVLDELPGGLVTQLLEDHHGDIWVGTDRGIARIDGRSFAIRRFLAGDGVAIYAYSVGSCAVLSDGQLLFGGRNGLTLIDPDKVERPTEPPPIVITRIAIGEREVSPARDDANSGVPVLEVPSDARSLAVEFSALDYSDPAHNRYAYRLEGYDRDWVRTGFDLRMAMYTNLPPGTYRLRLRGTDHTGAWSPLERQLVVHVAAAWYQTMGFRILAVAGLVLVVFMIVQTRTVLLRARQRELESLVDERTNALVRATEERTTLIENLAHDLRTPLTSLRGYLESLSLKDDALSDPERSRFVGIAVRQVERLNRLVRELFDLVRLDDARPQLALERFSPEELVQDVVQEFRSIADGRSIVFEPDPETDGVQMVGDINLIQRMIENLVDNAVHHTPRGGTITVTLSSRGDQIVLEVRDTGRGIKPADLDRIFERYERGDTSGRIAGTGLGLAIVKRIVELHSGTISVQSQLWLGTLFTLRLPANGSNSRPAAAGRS